MNAINRAAVIEAAAKAVRAYHGNILPTGNRSYPTHRDLAAAEITLKVMAAGLLAPLRQLHTGEWHCGNPQHTNPSAACPECDPYCEACGVPMPCPTVRLIDQIEADAKGDER